MFNKSGEVTQQDAACVEQTEHRHAVNKGKRAGRPSRRRHAENQGRRRKENQELRTKFAKAARARRDHLAEVITARVEKAIDDRMESGEAQIAKVAQPFGELKGVLGAVGRKLDEQARRSERIAKSLERLPALVKKVPVHLEAIVEQVEHVPELCELVRQGTEQGTERLEALRAVQRDLVVQHKQGQALLQILQGGAVAMEGRLASMEDTLGQSAQQARADSAQLREAMAGFGDRLVTQQEETSVKDSERTREVVRGLDQVSNQLREASAAVGSQTAQQREAAEAFQEAQRKHLTRFDVGQSETLSAIQSLQQEMDRRQERSRRRQRLFALASLSAVAVWLWSPLLPTIQTDFFGRFVGPTDWTPVAAPVRPDAQATSAVVGEVGAVAATAESAGSGEGVAGLEASAGAARSEDGSGLTEANGAASAEASEAGETSGDVGAEPVEPTIWEPEAPEEFFTPLMPSLWEEALSKTTDLFPHSTTGPHGGFGPVYPGAEIR